MHCCRFDDTRTIGNKGSFSRGIVPNDRRASSAAEPLKAPRPVSLPTPSVCNNIMRLAVLFFLSGILLFQQLREPPEPHWLAASLLIPLAWRWHPLRMPAALLAGFLWTLLHATWTLQGTLPKTLEGADVVIEGHIASLVEEDDRRARFRFFVERLYHGEQRYTTPRRVLLSWYGADRPALKAGDRWRLTVRLKRPHGFMNPGGFDYEGWLFQQGIQATGYVRNKGNHTPLAAKGLSRPIDRLRHHLRRQMKEQLGEHPLGGLVQALTIGERSAIRPEQWRVLTDTGTNHLMAISGLHVGLVAGMVFFLIRRLWSLLGPAPLLLAAPRAAALAALLAASGYAALAGFSVPTQRALVMIAVVMGAIVWQRAIHPSHSLALALGGVLLLDPLAVMSSGFWLSFGAVAIILYGLGGRVNGRGGWKDWGRVQWVVTLGLLPLLAFFFHQAPLASPVANLIAVPWVSLGVVPAALLGTALLPFHAALGGLLLSLAATLLAWLWPLLEWLAELEPLQWQPAAAIDGWALIAALVGVAWLLAPRGTPARWVGVGWLLPLILGTPKTPAPGEVWFTLLDVGQGLAAVIQTHNHTLLYDTGPRFSDRFNAGEAVVIPFLRHQGIRFLDVVMVGHGDSDHSGGVHALLREYPVARLLTTVPENLGTEAELCRQGESWTWDEVRFTVLHPPAPVQGGTGNDASCVLKVESAGASLLLPGDIERKGERKLVNGAFEKLKADLLVAPHHGSKSSSSPRFIDAVAPRYVLFSVGYRNRFRHPHPLVVERYEARGIRLLDTATSGAIHFRLNDRGLSPPRRHRIEARHYWNDG